MKTSPDGSRRPERDIPLGGPDSLLSGCRRHERRLRSPLARCAVCDSKLSGPSEGPCRPGLNWVVESLRLEVQPERVMLTGMTDRKPKRRWFQYSLRTLLVFVTLSAIPCSWLSVKMRQAERQRQAATAIEKLGGTVTWNDVASKRPAWLRSLLGSDFFDSVEIVVLNNAQVTDAGLEHLRGLSQLQELFLANTKVTDTGLENLKGLSHLQWLWLDETQVTDAGLAQPQGVKPTGNLEPLQHASHLRRAGKPQRLAPPSKVDARRDAGNRRRPGEHLRGVSQLQVSGRFKTRGLRTLDWKTSRGCASSKGYFSTARKSPTPGWNTSGG